VEVLEKLENVSSLNVHSTTSDWVKIQEGKELTGRIELLIKVCS
jgi:hypothetical protein